MAKSTKVEYRTYNRRLKLRHFTVGVSKRRLAVRRWFFQVNLNDPLIEIKAVLGWGVKVRRQASI